MNGQACTLIYECDRAQMVPMIRSLRRCTAAEALESVCSNCAQRPGLKEVCQSNDPPDIRVHRAVQRQSQLDTRPRPMHPHARSLDTGGNRPPARRSLAQSAPH